MTPKSTAEFSLPLRQSLARHSDNANGEREALEAGEDILIASTVALAAMEEMAGEIERLREARPKRLPRSLKKRREREQVIAALWAMPALFENQHFREAMGMQPYQASCLLTKLKGLGWIRKVPGDGFNRHQWARAEDLPPHPSQDTRP